jgi:Fe-S-cluster containining protein
LEIVSGNFSYQVQTRFGELRGDLPLPDSPIRLAEFARLILAFDERLIALAAEVATEDGTARISCKAGCGACCRQAAPVSIPEAFHLRDLLQAMPETRRVEILGRFESARTRIRSGGIDADLRPGETADERWSRLGLPYFALGVPCPFLEEESCSIHPDRPTICREFLVTSPAEACSDPALEDVRGIDNVFVITNSLARLAAVLMEGEPHPMPLTHALAWAEENLEWDEKRFDPAVLCTAFFDILANLGEEY